MVVSMSETWQADALKKAQAMLPPVSRGQQQAALSRFIAEGFPTRRHENWKYTMLQSLASQHFSLPSVEGAAIDIAPLSIPDTHRIVFLDGRHVPSLSNIEDLPKGVRLTNSVDEKLEIDLALPELYQTPFSNLNAALLTDGLFLRVSKNIKVTKPIHIVHCNTGSEAAVMHHPRHQMVAESGSEVSVFEEYLGFSDSVYFTNVVTQIMAKPNSVVRHYKLQRESDQAFHIANTVIEQQRDSFVSTASVTLGAKLSRDDLSYALSESGAEALLLGLYHLQGQRHADHHTRIDHRVPRCVSEQQYKGIVGDASRAVFNGKVLVEAGASKTATQQSNQNLLLSKKAEVDTKPELEIYTDDVRCTHGATVGQLDKKALFYLQSRGIEQEAARHLLTCGFANEVLERLPKQSVSEHITQQVISRLATSQCLGDCHHE